MKSPSSYWIYALALLAFASLGRLAPMPENFTPVAAVALFGGFLLPRGWQAVAVVWATLLITDLFLGLYNPALMAAVYIAACAPIGLRSFLRKNPTVWRAGGCALAGSALFFVSTNTAVWMLGTGYSPDASGLLASLSAGVPFWRNALLGDLMFSTLLFGAWVTAGQTISSCRDLRRDGRLLPDGVSSH
ncbi:MAG: hypothetical protein CBD11_03845 [Phycisphaera sp. TMED151]|nr:MAG: hypothetical protein CBD11_03845 [Phycisphaera sp. TMED151]RZO56564.1 MAG: hypothetical protein EVA77_00735 [Phycisphaeraceae bacterium]